MSGLALIQIILQIFFYNWLGVSTLDWEGDFEIWFEGIKGQLGEDVATSILTEINDLRQTQILPIEAGTYNEISQWADIFIPDADRGEGSAATFINLRGK